MTATFFAKYKILPPLAAYIAGILIASHSDWGWEAVVYLSPLIGAAALLKPRFAPLVFIPIGILFAAERELPPNHVSRHAGRELNLDGTLYKSPEQRERGTRLFLEAQRVFIAGAESPVRGRAIITTEEPVVGLAYGERIRVIGLKLRPVGSFKNPGSFDARAFYERQGIRVTGFVPGASRIISFGRDENSSRFIRAIDGVRLKFADFIRRKAEFPENEVIAAITVGEQSRIPADLRRKLSETGIIHVVSISGLHVGAVAFVFYFLIKWTLKRSEYLLLRYEVPRIAALITIFPLFTYVILAGFATPAVRAFIMAAVYLVSIAAGRDENKLNTLGVAALIILIAHPGALFELSFQLSFVSVLALLLVNRFYPLKVATFGDKILSSAKTSLAASLATMPFIVNHFGILSLVSVPANLLCVPFIEFIATPLGLLSFLTYFVSEAATAALLQANVLLVKSVIWASDQFLKIPFAALTVPSWGALGSLFYALALAPALLWRTHPRLRLFLPVFALAFVATSAYRVWGDASGGTMRVSFLDAGSKNIAFAELPGGVNILIAGGFSYFDRGGFIERSVAIPFMLKSGAVKIDYFILTSLDKDHLQGAQSILERFRVENLWTNGGKLHGGLWELVYAKKIKWKNVSIPQQEARIGDLQIEFIQPRGDSLIPTDSRKSYPLLVKFDFRGAGFLFAEGIADEPTLSQIAREYGDKIRSDVVFPPKLPQKLLSGFIEATSPKIAVAIGAGGDKLSVARGVRFFHTQRDGAVFITADGETLRVKTYSGGAQSEY
ncbi:MAG: ComEC/Rec2 family competence protein [Deltaproteobacteria bacterium]